MQSCDMEEMYCMPLDMLSYCGKAVLDELPGAMQGVFLGTIEGFAYLVALAGGTTEIVKLFQGSGSQSN